MHATATTLHVSLSKIRLVGWSNHFAYVHVHAQFIKTARVNGVWVRQQGESGSQSIEEKTIVALFIDKEKADWMVLFCYYEGVSNNVEAHGSQEHWKI